MMSGGSVANFEHILHFVSSIIVKFNQISIGWAWEIYFSMDLGNLLGYIFLFFFTQNKVVKG